MDIFDGGENDLTHTKRMCKEYVEMRIDEVSGDNCS